MATLKITRFIQAPVSEVYLYFTNSTALRDWLCDGSTADPRVGGRLYLWWNSGYYTSGEYKKLEQDRLISFIWFGRGEPHSTQVNIRLMKQRKGTLLKLTHGKIGKTQHWVEIGNLFETEWNKALENLASVLETGPDLRITTRPMLGITTDEFNSAIAQKLGIPVSQGLRIAGVVEGMGAQKAGLQSDDVIVKLDEYEITGGSVFSIFIQKHKAGDVLKVTYYRGSEKRITEMTLSSRPIPPIPVSCSELLKQVQPVYQHYEDELEDVLKNSTDEECSKKPTPREWSAKEVIAHLIHSELGWQNVMSEIMGGYEGSYDDFGGNNQAHIDGTVATFSTKDELFRELKDHDAETLNMVSHIPSEFLTHKGKYWKLVFQINQNAFHLQSHLDQIRSAIHAARNS